MRKLLGFIVLVVMMVSVTSCSLLDSKTKKVILSDADVIQIQNSVTDVVNKVDPACIGVIAKSTSSTGYSSGSGVVVKQNGSKYYAITNYHVIEDTSKVEVYINDSVYIDAKVYATLEAHDLACLEFEASSKYNVGVVDITKNSITVNPGETVIAIGCPLGLSNFNTVTTGVISRDVVNMSISLSNGSKSTVDVIQHDAAINSGNSGGALFNVNGDLIGINFEKTTMTSSGVIVEGMYYAIFIDEVISFVKAAELI